MKIEQTRSPFDMSGPQNMLDDAELVVAAVRVLESPEWAVAEMLAHVSNMGYLLALRDLQTSIDTMAKDMPEGTAAVAGMRMASEKIRYAHDEMYAVLKARAACSDDAK